MRSLCVLFVASLAGAAAAVPPRVTDPADRQILEAFLGHVEKSGAYCTPERMAKFAAQPEDIVWQASRYIALPLVAYRLTEEPKHLDVFVERMDTLCKCLSKGPDDFLGWYGLPLSLFRHPDHPDLKVDVILTSFEVTGLMAEFACAVQASDALKAKHADAVRRYLDIAENHLVKKWDARGRFKDLGDGGAVYITHADLKPVKASLTQPHNKHSKILQALTALYAATGKDEYLARAVKLGTRFKRCLTLVGDHYVWNYWDPSGAWDVDPAGPAKWKHWIGPEHTGGYFGLTLSQAVFLYEHGLVFDRTDVERFVKTQTTVCWNGDAERPKWANAGGKPSDKPYLCAWLAPFDERVYAMAFGPAAQAERLKGKDHSWQGSVVAMGWLEFKLINYPRWKSGKPAEEAVVAPFVAKPENQAFLKRLAIKVEGTGYKPPFAPAEMKPMP